MVRNIIFIQVKQNVYLITNNQVVGGKFHTEEFRRMHRSDRRIDTLPDVLNIRLYGNRTGEFEWHPMALKDNNGNPLYIKFYENESDTLILLDVVAIPLAGVNSIKPTFPINGYTPIQVHQRKLYPSQGLFVVGFPTGINLLYPVCKKGTIASEPNLQAINSSSFYTDATTRDGMSGSPVLFNGSIAEVESKPSFSGFTT